MPSLKTRLSRTAANRNLVYVEKTGGAYGEITVMQSQRPNMPLVDGYVHGGGGAPHFRVGSPTLRLYSAYATNRGVSLYAKDSVPPHTHYHY